MPILAVKTLALIDSVMEEDQGRSYKKHLGELMPTLRDAYTVDEGPYRSHLGASLIGRECARELWYGFRWVGKKSFPARVLRMFNRGHLEEGRFIALLKSIGCEVWSTGEDGGQIRLSAINHHFGSALDGVVRGVPDLPPGSWAIAEFKTASTKVFEKMERYGVAEEKLEHYVQMQMYMHLTGIQHSLYLMVNKDNDALYGELVAYNQELAMRYLERAEKIISARVPPPQIHPSAGWFGCKYCDYFAICKGQTKVEADVNCRTCRFAVAHVETSMPLWSCQKGQPEISSAAAKGCSFYEKIEGL